MRKQGSMKGEGTLGVNLMLSFFTKFLPCRISTFYTYFSQTLAKKTDILSLKSDILVFFLEDISL